MKIAPETKRFTWLFDFLLVRKINQFPAEAKCLTQARGRACALQRLRDALDVGRNLPSASRVSACSFTLGRDLFHVRGGL